MALIRRADAQTATRDALVLDLGDLARQGDSIIQQARRRAAEIVEEAAKERLKILAGGREAGHAEGLAAGTKEGLSRGAEEGRAAALLEARPRIEALCAAWRAGLDSFIAERESLMAEAREHVLDLAIEIASRVTRRVIAADPSLVAAQLEAVLSLVARPTRVRIAVHPEDESIARQVLPELVGRLGNIRHAEIVADPAVERGSCTLRTDGGASIDAGIGTQLDRIVEAILPEKEVA